MSNQRSDQDSVYASVQTHLRGLLSSAERNWGHATAGITDILQWTWERLLHRKDDGVPHAYSVLIAHGWDHERATTIICAAVLEEFFLQIHDSLRFDRECDMGSGLKPDWVSVPGRTDHDRRASALIAADLCAVMSSSLLADLDAPATIRVSGLRALSEGVMGRSIDSLQGIMTSSSLSPQGPRLLDRLVHAMTDSALLTASPHSGMPPEHIS